jgi:hypothetical protein
MVEQAKYEVLREINNVEIRRYPSLVTARVDGYGDGGFNLLFNFITGNNQQKSKIAMTAPVVSEQIAMTAPVLSESDSIGFVMPEGLTLETTPEPLGGEREMAMPVRSACSRQEDRLSRNVLRPVHVLQGNRVRSRLDRKDREPGPSGGSAYSRRCAQTAPNEFGYGLANRLRFVPSQTPGRGEKFVVYGQRCSHAAILCG